MGGFNRNMAKQKLLAEAKRRRGEQPATAEGEVTTVELEHPSNNNNNNNNYNETTAANDAPSLEDVVASHMAAQQVKSLQAQLEACEKELKASKQEVCHLTRASKSKIDGGLRSCINAIISKGDEADLPLLLIGTAREAAAKLMELAQRAEEKAVAVATFPQFDMPPPSQTIMPGLHSQVESQGLMDREIWSMDADMFYMLRSP